MVGGLRIVALGLVTEQLREREVRPDRQSYCEFVIRHLESADLLGGCDVSQRSRHQAPIREELAQADVEEHTGFVLPAANPPNRQAEGAGERFCRIIHGRQPVQPRAERIKDLIERGLEELFFAVEVVVKGTHPDVGSLGDLQHRYVEPARGDESLPALTSAARVRGLRRSSRFAGSRGWSVMAFSPAFIEGITLPESVSYESIVILPD